MPLCHQQVDLSGIRNLNQEDGVPLGKLLFDAFHNSPDDEGESAEVAIEEAQNTLSGKYGPIVWDASFVLFDYSRFVSTSIISIWGKSERPLISFTATLPEYRGKGIASNLINASINALLLKGYKEIDLFVSDDNFPAIRLYEKLGFTIKQIKKQ